MEFARLQRGDATSLEFLDSSFDFVYSYHALEHISDPMMCLREMKRVLKPGGGYWIGTPNRHRILGYIGSKNATLSKKVRYNLVDWKARLTGNFRNELGAHAGFSARELENMLRHVFGESKYISDQYYEKIYERKKLFLSGLRTFHLTDIAYPSVYFIGSG